MQVNKGSHSAVIIVLSCFVIITPELFSQGFNTFNNRNHPYLNWQVAETENFKIMYPERISGIEVEAASIAEESYRALVENLEVSFSKKIRIYLSDEDEINNGFASPIGKGYTNIWVNLNDYSEIWTGREKWLRKVIAHELAHIFHFKSVWTHLGLNQYLVADPIPSFWAEGLAQYQTEKWDSQRGDRWLRKAIFDSRPSFRDGQSIENGRLMYASGNSQLRYFTEKYGDSTLVDLFSHRQKLLGILEYHDFYDAFDEAVEGGYDAFFEDWRKHMNVYYNTLASQMERTDSLQAEKLNVPGQFYYDMAASPDDSLFAVLSLTSLNRPVRRLYIVQNDSTMSSSQVAEGGINRDLGWSRDSKKLFYSRTVRGEKSSLVNDIYLFDLEAGKERRVTRSRRAKFPVQGPGENQIGYVVNEGGTGNLFEYDLETGAEYRVTNYRGDVQLLWPLWIEQENSWLVHRFAENGDRFLTLTNRKTGNEFNLDDGQIDNRKAVLSPDGKQIAYTSLRDEVPNVFIYDFESGSTRRITNLFTGGEVYGWVSRTDTLESEKLLIKASETKQRDNAYLVDPNRSFSSQDGTIPEAYKSWRKKSPPSVLSSVIPPDEYLITDRYRYKSFRNITHAASLVLPYYSARDHWGLFGLTTWTEPLAKHMFIGAGNISFSDIDNSFGILSYINNQLYPTITSSVYKIPGSAFFYGNKLLIEELTGGDISLNIPLDLFDMPYQSGSFFGRFRHTLVKPLDRDSFRDLDLLPEPERARQTDLSVGLGVKKQRPWRDNNIHPLDGRGVRLVFTGAEKILGSDVRFATADIGAFTVLPSLGLHRIYLHGRYQVQWGTPLPQSFIGFSRFDNIHLNLPGEVPISLFNEAERVRGYRGFVAGRQVLFGSLEYRVPFLPSLGTKVLGMLELGSTSLALFTDAGVVRNVQFADEPDPITNRWGAGAEVKNEVSLFGINFIHSLGVAQPAQELFTDVDVDLYYRVRAVVPF